MNKTFTKKAAVPKEIVMFNLEEIFKQQKTLAEAEMSEILGESTNSILPMTVEEQRFVALHQSAMEDLIEPFVSELTNQVAKIYRNELFSVGVNHLTNLKRLSSVKNSSRPTKNAKKKELKRPKSSSRSLQSESGYRRWTTLQNLSVAGEDNLAKKKKSKRTSTPKKPKTATEREKATDPIDEIIREVADISDLNDSYNCAINS